MLRSLTGKKFGIDVQGTIIVNDEGAEVDSIEVIRDNDKLYIVEIADLERV